MGKDSRVKLRRITFWLGIVCSMGFYALTGIDLSFNTYALALKETFNFTQTQVETIGSMGTIGMCLGSMEPVVSAYLGSAVSCWFVLVAFPVSSGMFAVAARYKDIFSMWPGLICLFQLFMSTSNVSGFLIISQISIQNIASNHKMKMVGLMHAFNCLGKVILGLLITVTLGDLVKFFGTLAFVMSAFSWTTFFLLMPFAKTTREDQERISENSDPESLLLNPKDKLTPSDEKRDIERTSSSSIKTVLTSTFFHAIFWPSCLYYSCGFALLNNITVLAKTMNVENPINSVYIISGGIITLRLLTGVLIDFFDSIIFDFFWLLTSVSLFMLGLVLGMFYLQVSTLYIFAVLVSFSMSATFSVCASLVFRQFGQKHYGLITGLFYIICGISQIILQLVIGLFYDHVVLSNGYLEHECFGRECFFWSLVIMLTLTLLILFVLGFTAVWYTLNASSKTKSKS